VENSSPTPTKPIAFSFRPTSIRQQLPLLICLLLLTLITVFGTVTYIAIRRIALSMGQERLRSMTEEFSSFYRQAARTLSTATQNAANQKEIVSYLSKNSAHQPPISSSMPGILQKVLVDSQMAWIELTDTLGRTLVYTDSRIIATPAKKEGGTAAAGNIAKPDASEEIRRVGKDSSFVGKLYLSGDSMYYPIIATVMAHRQPVGYLLRWRVVRATPGSVSALSRLIGSKAAVYFGNNDGSLWTDMLRPVAAPPFDVLNIQKPVTYRQREGNVIAFAKPIAGSKWTILIEVSEGLVLEAADRFLYLLIAIGGILIVIGSLIAWKISRNITRPLDRLIMATTAIAGGDYSSSVVIDRRDELGMLAESFNSMASQVHQAHDGLENKVRARTEELVIVNKELEAFSYSVSHDLRAPLRAISGYAMMLKEDYEARFDDEARRITGNIISNVKMMGQLIDDLIAFSRLGKREVTRLTADMTAMAEFCIAQLSLQWSEKKFSTAIAPLPPCLGDEDLLKQVWMNLLSNAFKYSSKQAEPKIEVGFTRDGAETVYFVRDNGAGFDMKYADKLFKVFQRLHTQDEFEGTGVGLALVRRIIDKHKGRIWAISRPGYGACFYFSLPN
jgi:signal transduction histidine kinase